jgi:erythromycin esterase-like protein
MDQSTAERVREKSYRLSGSRDLDPLLERIGNARFVLLGEASHGTHEYYTWRTAISKRLIAEKGFNFIAVEGDWPDCYKLNRYVKGLDQQDEEVSEVLRTFNRWPTWMWANWEIAALISWMKDHNAKQPPGKKAGFYGLDVYSLWESMFALINYLRKTDPPVAKSAEAAMECFTRYGKNEQLYVEHPMTASCREEVIRLLLEIRKRSIHYNGDPEASLNTLQNAYVAKDAEEYYASMISFNDASWNVRDRHMMETLQRLVDFHGEKTKAIIWEHNTHIGDARFTDMKDEGMLNVGQLVRETYTDDDTVLVGFGSYSGKVLAGRAWGGLVEDMDVPNARLGSFEDILHSEAQHDRLLIFDRNHPAERFKKITPHRAIGVVYHPEHEFHNYVPSVMNGRYDAFVYIDQTTALHDMHIRPSGKQIPETYPFEF